MQIRVYFSNMAVLECMDVVNTRHFWRYVSKYIKYERTFRGEKVRVIKVEKGVKI